jgi:hypothetical protein
VKITLSDQVIFQELEDEAILLDLNGEAYYGLDQVGMRLWQLLSEDGDLDHAVAQLLQEYEVEETELRTDMLELLNDMADAGLVAIEADLE